jgi:hypothetical protein
MLFDTKEEREQRLATSINEREELILQIEKQHCHLCRRLLEEDCYCDKECAVWRDIAVERKMIAIELEAWISIRA